MRVPFENLPGDIPPETKRAIQRNFQEIENKLTSGGTYDAFIDPSISVSVPSTHTYKNFTDLVANESWSTSKEFLIGVKLNAVGSKITEGSNGTIAFPGPVHVIGLGMHADNYARQWGWDTLAHRTRVCIDMNGSHFTAQGPVFFEGLHFVNTGAGIQYLLNQSGGNGLILRNCVIQGNGTQDDGTSLGQTINQGSSFSTLAYDTLFVGCDPADNQVVCFNCHMIVDQNLTMSEYLYWDGGIWQAAVNGITISIGDAHSHFLRFTADSIDGGGAGVNWTIQTLGNIGSNDTHIECTGLGENQGSGPDFLHDPTITGFLRLRGRWRSVSANGPGLKDIQVSLVGSSTIPAELDATAPADIKAVCATTVTAGVNVKLRGANLKADLSCSGGAGPQVQGISLTDSLITMTTQDSSQALALDANSKRNLVLLGGAGNATETPPGYVDSGTNNRIITYLTDSGLSTSILNQLGVTVGRPMPLPEPLPTEAEMEPWWMPVGGAVGPQGPQGPAGPSGAGGGGAAMPLADPVDDNAEPWWAYVGGPVPGAPGTPGTVGPQGPQGSVGSGPLADYPGVDDNYEPWWMPVGQTTTPNYRRVGVANQDYTMAPTDETVVYVLLSATHTVTLPLAGPTGAGRRVYILDEFKRVTNYPTAVSIDIAPQGSDTLEGGTVHAQVTQTGGYCCLESDGTSNWKIVDQSPDWQVFNTPPTGTWTKRPGYSRAHVWIVAPGSGGGSGRDGTNNASAGGGGGVGGSWNEAWFQVSDLGTTETVTVPDGGAGGTAAAAASNGNQGGGSATNGEAAHFGTHLGASSGPGGAGGTTVNTGSQGTWGGAVGVGCDGGVGFISATTAGDGMDSAGNNNHTALSGGALGKRGAGAGGGGGPGSLLATAGGAGGSTLVGKNRGTVAAGGAGLAGSPGGDGAAGADGGPFMPGCGGSGGGGGGSTAATGPGKGGAGGNWGGGGGGSGGSVSGGTAARQAGGKGGKSGCVVVCYR